MQDDMLRLILKACGEDCALACALACKRFRDVVPAPYKTRIASFRSVGMLRWARDIGYVFSAKTFAAMALAGNLEMLKFLYDAQCPYDFRAWNAAAAGGNLDALVWLQDASGVSFAGPDTCAAAALNGHLGVLKYLHIDGCKWNSSTITAAAAGGHLDVVQWARDNGARWNYRATAAAEKHNHLHVLRWLRINGCPWRVTQATTGMPPRMPKILVVAGGSGRRAEVVVVARKVYACKRVSV